VCVTKQRPCRRFFVSDVRVGRVRSVISLPAFVALLLALLSGSTDRRLRAAIGAVPEQTYPLPAIEGAVSARARRLKLFFWRAGSLRVSLVHPRADFGLVTP